jgi:hypothetical protein
MFRPVGESTDTGLGNKFLKGRGVACSWKPQFKTWNVGSIQQTLEELRYVLVSSKYCNNTLG